MPTEEPVEHEEKGDEGIYQGKTSVVHPGKIIPEMGDSQMEFLNTQMGIFHPGGQEEARQEDQGYFMSLVQGDFQARRSVSRCHKPYPEDCVYGKP
jgi:hypothetical protein